MILCDPTTCYSIESAWFQCLKLKYDKPLSNLAFNVHMRRYSKEWEYACRRGFRCAFDRGIFHLYINFKRARYRR